MGLVSSCRSGRRAGGAARALALEIAANAPLAVQASKKMMRMSGLGEGFNDHVHHVFLQLLPLMRSQDAAARACGRLARKASGQPTRPLEPQLRRAQTIRIDDRGGAPL